MIYSWNYPTTIKAGIGALQELPKLCEELGLKRPLLVTDPLLAELDPIQRVKSILQPYFEWILFHELQANPTGGDVAKGVAFCKEKNCDGIIAVGGGASLDVAKAIALMIGQKGRLWDYEDIGDNWTKVNEAGIIPVIAIPTTAGTGSEVGRASVITDTEAEVKKIIFHPKILPSIVVLDPELSVSLPKHVTAATGIDALSHNLEALCSPFYHPMAHGIAKEGILLIQQNLLKVYQAPNDLEARLNMLVASSMGATSFQKGLGAMHALAHPLGALYHMHHGLLNAILMPYVLLANKNKIEKTLTELARSMGLKPSFGAFLDWVLQLRIDLQIPHSFKEAGLGVVDFKRIGQMAVKDPSASGNPIHFNEMEYSKLCERAYEGIL